MACLNVLRPVLSVVLALVAALAQGCDAVQLGPEKKDGFLDSGEHRVTADRIVTLFDPQYEESGMVDVGDDRLLVCGSIKVDGQYRMELFLLSLRTGEREKIELPAKPREFGDTIGMVRLDARRVLLLDVRAPEVVSAIVDISAKSARLLPTPQFSGMFLLAFGDGAALWTGRKGSALFDPALESWTELPHSEQSSSADTATLLADDDVLITSAKFERGAVQPEAFVFSRTTRDFRSVSAPSKRRHSAHAVRLADGRVLLFGGRVDDGPLLADSEIYDPAADTWSPGPNLGEPIAHGDAFTHGTDTYIFGGLTQEPCATRDCAGEGVQRLRAGASAFERMPDMHPGGGGSFTWVRGGTLFVGSSMGVFRYTLPSD